MIPPTITPARQPGGQRHTRGTLWQYQERQQSYTTHDCTRGHNGNRTIVPSKLKFRGKQHNTPSTTDSHSVITHRKYLLEEHDVAAASDYLVELVRVLHGACQELATAAWRVDDPRVVAAALPPQSSAPSCVGQPRAMPWQASSSRTVASTNRTMTSKVASSCRGRERRRSEADDGASVRTMGGSHALQGRRI